MKLRLLMRRMLRVLIPGGKSLLDGHRAREGRGMRSRMWADICKIMINSIATGESFRTL